MKPSQGPSSVSWLRSLVRWLRWKRHLLVDFLGTLVWTRSRTLPHPSGFLFASGLHPAYAQMRQGLFEPEETALVEMLLVRVDRLVDVGANIGYYSCLALQHKRGLMAIEPQPRNLQCLYKNLLLNRWDAVAEVIPVALGESPGLLTLYGASGPSASLLKNWAGYSPRFLQVVPVSTLDNLLASRFAGERLLIKIDVEGAEYGVLRGAANTLRRDVRPIWLIEVCLHEFHPDGFNPDFLEVFKLFWELGYEAHTAETPPRHLSRDEVEAWWSNRRTDGRTFNYLFAMPGMLAGLSAP